jgi:hypothetical protein
MGGISKWMEGHIVLYSKKDTLGKTSPFGPSCSSANRKSHRLCISPVSYLFSFNSSPEIRKTIRLYLSSMARCFNRSLLKDELIDLLYSHLKNHGNNKNDGLKQQICHMIIEDLENSYIKIMIRKSFLSILYHHGVRILKTDLEIPTDEDPHLFCSLEELNPLLKKLRIIAKNSLRDKTLFIILNQLESLQQSSRSIFDAEDIYHLIEKNYPYF